MYRAVDTRLGRVVALKTIDAGAGGAFDSGVRDRVMRGLVAVSAVDHPNLVQVLDFGIADGLGPYVVMEYLRGETLESLLRRRGGALDVAEAVGIALTACAALRACHRAGVVHGALTTRKIFIVTADTGAEIKLLDAGLSATPAAPADDQYALAALLEACLSGRLPEELQPIVGRAMRPAPEDRYESIHAFGQALWSCASPLGKDRWRSIYRPGTERDPDAAADRSETPETRPPFQVPTKVLDRTLLLPDSPPGGVEQRALPVPVPGGTVLDQGTNESSAGSASDIAPPAWAAPPRARPRRPWLVPVTAASAGVVLLAIVAYAALGGRSERLPARSSVPQVIPSAEGEASPAPRPAPLTVPPTQRPASPPSVTTSNAASNEPAPVRKRAFSRRHGKRRAVDANGIGILD